MIERVKMRRQSLERSEDIERLETKIQNLGIEIKVHPWKIVVKLVKNILSSGTVPHRLAWRNLVMIPKPCGKDFRGIGLNETLWKIVSHIINIREQEGIVFHKWIHGFRGKRGTATAILELNMASTLARNLQDPLYTVFLDLKKSYDSVYRQRLINFLRKYGFGPNTLSILNDFWKKQKAVVKQGLYFGKTFSPSRGVTQGDIISPMIFNIIVDRVVRDIHEKINHNQYLVIQSTAIFYADDGDLFGCNPHELQDIVNQEVDLFKSIGLYPNTSKTKCMITIPPQDENW